MVKLRRFRMCFAFTLLMGMLVLLSGCSSTSSPSQTSSTVDCPLAVYLDFPQVSYETALTAPVHVTGYVNKPQAKVTANEVEVKVGKNGIFSTKVQFKEGNNLLEVVATLDEQTDTMSYVLTVDNGMIYLLPHQSFDNESRLIFDRIVEMKAGDTKILDVMFDVRKEIRQPEEFIYTISFVGKEYSESAIPMPEGLDVIIEPSHFIGCPNMTYHSTLTFKTADTLTPGEYWFVFQQRTGTGGKTTSWILVTVQP